jgi:hypothetical protein
MLRREEAHATVANNDEERITAKGLKSPGPLLIVKKRLAERGAFRMRVIVSNREAAEELVAFFEARGGVAEIDPAGEDFHVVADLRRFKDNG